MKTPKTNLMYFLWCFQIVTPRGTVSSQKENAPQQLEGYTPQQSSSKQTDDAADSERLVKNNVDLNKVCDQNRSDAETTGPAPDGNSAVVAWSPFPGFQSIGNIVLGIHKALRRSLRRSLFLFTPELHLQ